MFCDASFAADTPHSKSTSGSFLALVGPSTFCPLSWMVKRQGCTTHSSSEAEIVSMDAALRTQGIPVLIFWDCVVGMFAKCGHNRGTHKTHGKRSAYGAAQGSQSAASSGLPRETSKSNYGENYTTSTAKNDNPKKTASHHDFNMNDYIPMNCSSWDRFGSFRFSDCVADIIDYVPPSLPPLQARTFLKVLEDNDAVIHMCVKARAPKLRHLARTIRIDLDWLFERFLSRSQH